MGVGGPKLTRDCHEFLHDASCLKPFLCLWEAKLPLTDAHIHAQTQAN